MLRNIFTMRNTVIDKKYHLLCCGWTWICSDNSFLVLMLSCSLRRSMDHILDELSNSVPILLVMAWMKLPQSWHGKEEVVRFPAELMMFSVVQLDQSCISYNPSKVTLRQSASSYDFLLMVTAIGWSQPSHNELSSDSRLALECY